MKTLERMRLVALAFIAMPLALAACNKTEPVAPPPPPARTTPPPPPAPPSPPPAADPAASITIDNADEAAAALEKEIDSDE